MKQPTAGGHMNKIDMQIVDEVYEDFCCLKMRSKEII